MGARRLCQVLDINAKRCRRPARYTVQYHGESELYGFSEPSATWVLVVMCDRHAEAVRHEPKKAAR